jgi:galactokinase
MAALAATSHTSRPLRWSDLVPPIASDRLVDGARTVRASRERDAATAARSSPLRDSLRDDFEISTGDVDRLVALACAESDVRGARTTVGDFGGAVVALCRPPHACVVMGRVMDAYRFRTNHEGAVLLPWLS